jgi:hypothetical protein
MCNDLGVYYFYQTKLFVWTIHYENQSVNEFVLLIDSNIPPCFHQHISLLHTNYFRHQMGGGGGVILLALLSLLVVIIHFFHICGRSKLCLYIHVLWVKKVWKKTHLISNALYGILKENFPAGFWTKSSLVCAYFCKSKIAWCLCLKGLTKLCTIRWMCFRIWCFV